MSLTVLLARAYPAIQRRLSDRLPSPCVLFVSVCDGESRARVYRGAGPSVQEAWADAIDRCKRAVQRLELSVSWLRVDWPVSVQATTWGQLKKRLALTKRNYFRMGLSLDAELKHAFLDAELNAAAVLYLGSDKVHAGVNENNFSVHARRRFGNKVTLDFADDNVVHLFTHEGVFLSQDELLPDLPLADDSEAHPSDKGLAWLPGPSAPDVNWRNASSLNAGRRSIETLRADQVYTLIRSSANFLAQQVKSNGKFVYGHFPCFAREVATYNNLRHASSVYAMLEGWELTRDETLLAAIRKALGYLTDTIIRRYQQADGSYLAFNAETNGELKLGANAVSLLALVKYDELTGDTRHRPLMEELALGIARMQDPSTGRFVHVLNASDLSVKNAFRIVYYDGEAAFGLMRLYGLTNDPRWLAIVEHAFDHFIEASHWKHHDHWLSYCANELTLHRPEEKYFRFGVQNIADYLEFILRRETTFPTLLELCMAAEAMVRRINEEHPEMGHVLDGLDIPKFQAALHHRAHYLLNGFFWPELAMYFAKPRSIVGSFFIRHHSFRARIDDVEHYLSGYVAYWKMLNRKTAFETQSATQMIEASNRRNSTGLPQNMSGLTGASGKSSSANIFDAEPPLSAHNLAATTRGRWITPPGPGWQATGVCTYAPAFEFGQLLCAKHEDETGVLSQETVRTLASRGGSAIMCVDGRPFLALGLPILEVDNVRKAVMDLGRSVRDRYKGKVIGITGSAGKTTTARMMAHALNALGPACCTRENANLPVGIAWNLASMLQAAPYWVVEMAIGHMEASTKLTRPDLAVVTNVGPSHLEFHHSTESIAIKKSRIFDGMSAGGLAVLCRDITHFDVFYSAARRRKLTVFTYGTHSDADLQLLNATEGRIKAAFNNEMLEFQLRAPGHHMALNALAVLSILILLKTPWRWAMQRLATFDPIEGRGLQHQAKIMGKRITILDESYNANPLSMAAALSALTDRSPDPQRCIIVLGDMKELGEDEVSYHVALKDQVLATGARRVLLCGPLMHHLWQHMAQEVEQGTIQGEWVADLDSLETRLPIWLRDGDTVLVKSSNSMGLARLVDKLLARSENSEQSPCLI